MLIRDLRSTLIHGGMLLAYICVASAIFFFGEKLAEVMDPKSTQKKVAIGDSQRKIISYGAFLLLLVAYIYYSRNP